MNLLHIALAKDNSSPPIWGQFKDPHLGVSAQSQKALNIERLFDFYMESIENHISKDLADLEKAKRDGDAGKQAHLKEELERLETYKRNHPDEHKDPSPLELHCEINPDAPECLFYDD